MRDDLRGCLSDSLWVMGLCVSVAVLLYFLPSLISAASGHP